MLSYRDMASLGCSSMKSTSRNDGPAESVRHDLGSDIQIDPEVVKHFKKGELEALCSLDFHFKEVNNRFKKLGL